MSNLYLFEIIIHTKLSKPEIRFGLQLLLNIKTGEELKNSNGVTDYLQISRLEIDLEIVSFLMISGGQKLID